MDLKALEGASGQDAESLNEDLDMLVQFTKTFSKDYKFIDELVAILETQSSAMMSTTKELDAMSWWGLFDEPKLVFSLLPQTEYDIKGKLRDLGFR
ncbi:hypothetical protein IFR05_012129 [Cadophora sp. M221]|nr:hypothetical protein IFR05_012129 [Cadophora sp. M221]